MTTNITAPFVPPPAGAWIQNVGCRSHLFEGDMTWRPRYWAGPSLETACGFQTSSLVDVGDVRVSIDRPVDACRNCSRRERSR